ncbi:hypothetical protein QAD02_015847 [Eretmocerus hayati]|uniref:Uncharacterized protein n=1 Tax=Eretmocerus hayati TaxID=131215 RepID=A0ACC2P9H4_9HYME|nr:hypothetical protein QAD02_015847 [Eretmocerus hayati]
MESTKRKLTTYATVNTSVCDDWEIRLLVLIVGYNLADIFNGDELALFWKYQLSQSLVLKGDACHGGKLSKENFVSVDDDVAVTGEMSDAELLESSKTSDVTPAGLDNE